MCISHSVGTQATNNVADIKLVQILLNENLGRLLPSPPLKIDGQIGSVTLERIREFQERVVKLPIPSRRVEPGSETLHQLRSGMTPGLTAGKLQGIMLPAVAGLICRYFEPLRTMLAKSQIDTPLRVAHFLSQVGHESGDLRYSEEVADGSAYEDRVDLGNTQPGDGPRFKGRGLIQLTGRGNYAAFGKARNRDFLSPPNNFAIATDPSLAVDVSCWYWESRELNTLADADDLNAITLKVNGGFNGLADRAAHLRRAKCLLLP